MILIDARSPSEYAHAHIPGACSLPLLNDEERARVGTLYKQVSRAAAVEEGLAIFAPKMQRLLKEGKQLCGPSRAKVYCWRGGSRSKTLAWLLETGGIAVETIEGGYKAFRRKVLKTLSYENLKQFRFIVLTGMTGCGKTERLHELEKEGEQVIDLEKFANHRGSAFGHLMRGEQPSCEQFENLIAETIQHFNPARPIYIEDESRLIGSCRIPDGLFALKEEGERVELHLSKEDRIQRLVRDYGDADPQELADSVRKITKRLGSERAMLAIEQIEQGNLSKAFELVLHYYDRAYTRSV